MSSDVGATAPVPLAAFVGRTREVDEVRRLLDTTRLLTLTGAGGSGKTRIAIESVAPLANVTWIELAAITDPARLPAAVAAQLGIRDARTGYIDAITALIRDTPRTIVLDNCEHVIDAAAQLASSLLHSCPSLRILATSREPLALPGERAWLVPALSLPPRDATTIDPSQFDATRLFIERARDVAPSFSADEHVATITEICRRLDGMPLAIELAAARIRVLAPEQILARLHDRFRLLASSARTTVPRHQTLRATMDWSYSLLAPDEQRLLARLSVFGGDFTIDAVESVCTDDTLDPIAVLDVLARLVDRSLVTMREAGGAARYGLLETVRQYAAEHLADDTTLRHRHADYIVALVTLAEPHLTRITRRTWFDRLEREHHDIRAALTWTRDHAPSLHLDLVGRLCWFWFSSGSWSEARTWFAGALALPEATAPTMLRARALFAAGVVCCMQADGITAQPWLDEARTIAHAHNDHALEAYANNYLGMALVQQLRTDGDVPIRAAMTYFRAHDDLYGLRLALLLLGSWRLTTANDLPGAVTYFTQGLAVARDFGLARELGIAAQMVGSAVVLLGDYDRAAAHLHESITAFQQDPQPYFFSRHLDLCGVIVARRDTAHSVDAAMLMGAAASIRRRVGASLLPGDRLSLDPAIDLLHARMGQLAFDAAFAAGRALDTDAALALSINNLRPSATTTATAAPTVTTAIATSVDPELTVRGLGPLEILVGDRRLDRSAWGSPRARELFLYLLAHAPHGRRREDIGLVFWPDASAAQVKNSFHVLLHRLRKVLGRHDLIVVDDDRYTINPALHTAFDAVTFERDLRAAKRDPARLAATCALYRGDLFDGELAGDWHLPLQHRLRTLHADALSTLADLHLAAAANDTDTDFLPAATAVLEQLLRVDELREDAHRRLVLCYARAGQRDRALQHYDRLVDLLATELSARPSRATVELAERIRRADTV